MLSNYIVAAHKFNFIIDELNDEKLSRTIIVKLLSEQNQDASTIKILTLSPALKNASMFYDFKKECSNSTAEPFWNVILPPLSDLCCYQSPSMLFRFIHELKECQHIRRIFLWASVHNIPEPRAHFLLACFEYMADLVLHFLSPTELSIVMRKSGGAVSNKRYAYKRTKDKFLVEPLTTNVRTETPKSDSVPAGNTFKIELEEEELVARNALKLPYEKNKEADIVYAPEEGDDFDEEDPDEDLCI